MAGYWGRDPPKSWSNYTRPQWWLVNIVSGNNPIPEPMLTELFVAIGRHWSTMNNKQHPPHMISKKNTILNGNISFIRCLEYWIWGVHVIIIWMQNSKRKQSLETEGLVQDCSISTAKALEILLSCTKPSICVCLWRWKGVVWSDPVSYLWLSNVVANKRGRYICIVISHLPRLNSAIGGKQTLGPVSI